MTRRLYYEDADQRECIARVKSCRAVKAGYAVILDATVFYPEGGGQPCDLGVLESLSGGSENVAVRVWDVQEQEGEVVHFTDAALAEGKSVRCKIDGKRRLTHMREHSGEHIFSGIVCRLFSYSNVGFHMGKDCVTVDFSGPLTDEQIREAERLANQKVLENVEITAEYPTPERLAVMHWRSKKELTGQVRIVTVPGADCCACCGTHVKRTGEIGPIKVVGAEHFRGGSRLRLLIGEKALSDYESRWENVEQICALLSVKPEQAAEAVEKLRRDMEALRYESGALKLRLLEQMANAVSGQQASRVLFAQDLLPEDVRRLADRLQEKDGVAAVFSGDDRQGYQYVIISKERDVQALGKEFNEALHGRGGGRPPMIQGRVCATREKIETFLKEKGI